MIKNTSGASDSHMCNFSRCNINCIAATGFIVSERLLLSVNVVNSRHPRLWELKDIMKLTRPRDLSLRTTEAPLSQTFPSSVLPPSRFAQWGEKFKWL